MQSPDCPDVLLLISGIKFSTTLQCELTFGEVRIHTSFKLTTVLRMFRHSKVLSSAKFYEILENFQEING